MNKKITIPTLGLSLSLLLLGCNNSDQSTKTSQEVVVDKNAVTWVPDIKEALAKAKATNKLLFVECYSPSCPICQSIEPYFSTSEIAEKYNTDFVSYKLDVGVAEQVKFLNDRNIYLPSFPQFLFFDGDGNLVHQAEVQATTESILKVAADANSPEKRSSAYPARFEAGDRDFNFLVNYGVNTRLIKDTVANHKVADALFEYMTAQNLVNSPDSWTVTKKVVTSIDNGFFKHWINNIPRAAELEVKGGHPGYEKDALGGIIQISIFGSGGSKFDLAKIKEVKGYMNKIGAGQYADTYLWEHELKANLKEGKKEEALKVGKRTAKEFATNGASLVYITKVFNDKFPDNSYISEANQWLKTAATTLNANNHIAEYNYELARLSQKSGDMAAAKKNAQAALGTAKTAGIDTKKFEELVNSIK